MNGCITKLASELDKLLASTATLSTQNTNAINIESFKQRAGLIEQLSGNADELANIIASITSALDQMKKIHASELSTMDALINKKIQIQPAADDEWKEIKRKKEKTYSMAIKAPQIQPMPIPVPTPTSMRTVKITDKLALQATFVDSFNAVRSDGMLYYVESCEHFAVRIAGMLLHGNIGIIYTDEKNPEKIKDCKFAQGCAKRAGCSYYHDPMKFEGSTDHRNHVATGWLYVPPGTNYKTQTKDRRRFGSRAHLESDLANLHEDEISHFKDQVLHDILCALIATNGIDI